MQTTARRTVLAAAGTCALIVALLSLKPHQAATPGSGTIPTTGGAPSRGAAHGGGPSPSGSGTYTGDTVQTQYGPVQVEATVKAGRLTGVKVLRTPSANSRDRRIAADAVPRLRQEALAAQSAHIDAVSGATYTSQGYMQSLQSALDKAHG